MNRNQFERNIGIYFCLILVLFSVPIALVLIHDIDIWWHILLGKYYLTNFAIPDFSEFYFTPVNQDVYSIRFTWLGDILLYITYWAGGDIGLQFIRLILLYCSCYIIFLSGGKKLNGWKLFCLMGVMIGTYQIQLIRNSVFSIVFIPLIFYIWYLYKYINIKKVIWIYPVLMGVWGCIHGSYLLGFGLLALILLGDGLDVVIKSMRTSRRFFMNKPDLKIIGVYLLVLLLSFSLISVKNPKTKKYFSLGHLKRVLFIDNTFQNYGINGSERSDTSKSIDIAGENKNNIRKASEVNFFYWLKAKLNNTLFETQGAKAISGDFVSPFDSLDQLYVIISLVFCFLGLMGLFAFIRPFRFSHLLPVVAVIFLGCGYLRMIGYVPLVVASIWFISGSTGEFGLHIKDSAGYFLSFLLLISLYADYASGFKVRIGTKLHAVGFGRIPVYSEKSPNWIIDNYKNDRTFTIDGNGGYLLLKWYPEKKVFLDGFFEPHRVDVTSDYINFVDQQKEPDFLFDKYDVNSAILGLNIGNAIRPFVRSRDWFPACIDEGQIVFVHKSENDDMPVAPEILASLDEILKLPPQFRKLVAEYCFHIANSLLIKGHIKDAREYLEKNKQILEVLNAYASPELVRALNEKMDNLQNSYGLLNDRILYYEDMLSQAIRNNAEEKIIEYGFYILGKYPDTYHVIYNMAAAFLNQKKFHETRIYLNQLKSSIENKPDFFKKYHIRIAALYKKCFTLEKESGNIYSAFAFLMDSFLFGQNLISDVEFFKQGLFLYSDMKKAGKPLKAYEILSQLNQALPDKGRVLNAMAWHILTEPSPKNENISSAMGYAIKAVELMEREKDEIIDMAYDTLAEVYFRLGRFKEMEKYEEMAIRSAPDDRKLKYMRRPLKGK